MDCLHSRRHPDPRKAQLRKCTLHCMRCSCHRRSGGSSFRMIASMLKSGCRRCAAKGSRPRNESLPSRVQAGHTWWADGLSTTGSMHPRQKLHAKKALYISAVSCLSQVQARAHGTQMRSPQHLRHYTCMIKGARSPNMSSWGWSFNNPLLESARTHTNTAVHAKKDNLLSLHSSNARERNGWRA